MPQTSKTLIFGANGQVGKALLETLGDSAIAITRNDVDLSNLSDLKPYLSSLDFSGINTILNAAAYTNVEKAEEEFELAKVINGEAPALMAEFAKIAGCHFIHYSTDYVFDGKKVGEYTEEDKTNPLNAYGQTKLIGEENVLSTNPNALVLRTSWVYNESDKNFLTTMLNLSKTKDEISVVSDQVGSPTSAYLVAKYTQEALGLSGVYHLGSRNFCSWSEFAKEIFAVAAKNTIVNEISSKDYKTKAVRPLNSRLSKDKLTKKLDINLPTWEEDLNSVLKRTKWN